MPKVLNEAQLVEMDFLNEALIEQYKDYLIPVMEATNGDKVKAGKVATFLDNLSKEVTRRNKKNFGLNEAQVANFGPYKKHAMMLISTVMPNLLAEDIVSVQPIKQRLGQIFYLRYIYGSNKGNVAAGTVASDFEKYNIKQNYSADLVEGEGLGSTTTETDLTYTLSYYPVMPGEVQISNGSVNITDDGNGNLTGSGVSAGTIDYTNGRVNITLSSASAGDWEAVYRYDNTFAPAATIPTYDLIVDETMVRARSRKLRTLYSLDAAFDFEQQWGYSLDDELVKATAAEMKAEIDAEIMADIYNQAGLTSSWDSTYNKATANISYADFKETFVDELIKASNSIFNQTKRGKGTYVVVGSKAADILESMNGWEGSGKENFNGPYFAGTFRKKFKVYVNPFYAENAYLVGYKGAQTIDAGYVYAPYIPIFSSDLITLDDFAGRRAFGTSYAKKMISSNHFVKGTIS